MKTFIAFLLLCGGMFGAHAQPRIVIAGGSLAEIVYALGGGEEVVGVDQTTSYPPQTQALPKISNWQQLNIDGMLSLRPTLVMTWRDAQPQSVFDRLKQAGVEVALFQRTPSTPQQLFANIRQAALLLRRETQGEALVTSLQQRLRAAREHADAQRTRVSVLFLLSVGGGGAQVAGKDTVADGIITLAGGDNIASHRRYRPYGGEAMIAADPEVIVVTTQSLSAGIASLAGVPGITATRAWKNQRIIALDQAILLGMGPRIAEAVQALSQGFYPVE